jgi:hypothetical protein
MLKVVRWDDDDAIADDPLRVTPDDAIVRDFHLYALNNN